MQKLLILFVLWSVWVTACANPTVESPTQIPTFVAPTMAQQIILPTETQESALRRQADEINFNQLVGDKIVVAIEAYYQVEGILPESLDVLAPKYLDNIPVTQSGKPFEYRLNDFHGYLLSFAITGLEKVNGSCGYSQRDPFWDCGVSVEP